MSVRLQVIQEQLRAQGDLTAVQRFARLHDEGKVEAKSLYESRIPLTRPAPGQQYAFVVDLDACTGCKACVVGCNKMNGLDEDETWRAVGTLHGGSVHEPIQQTVTTACHHCLDPACMNGCPVKAYEKDPETGIVKHLDDQCIGCQYCTLTCPYDVPQYNHRLGIVRKCDMCQGRLAEQQAPACVESCPNGAIAISVVEVNQVRRGVQGEAFLLTAPSPQITAPTTRFKTKRDVPANVLPANFHRLRPAAKHLPLVVMLVLTQLSIGTYTLQALLSAVGIRQDWRLSSFIALSAGLLAMAAATLHLGRPLYAFRAFLGIRTSWMSREVIVLGAFIQLALIHALSLWWPGLFVSTGLLPRVGLDSFTLERGLAALTAALGLGAGLCSAMIYVVTRRKWWSARITGTKFVATGLMLGLATLTLARVVTLAFSAQRPDLLLRWFGLALVTSTLAKLAFEWCLLRHRFDDHLGDLKRSALLMTGQLQFTTTLRFALAAVGGIALPALVVSHGSAARPMELVALGGASLALLVMAELLERMLFFSAMNAPRMPGGVGK